MKGFCPRVWKFCWAPVGVLRSPHPWHPKPIRRATQTFKPNPTRGEPETRNPKSLKTRGIYFDLTIPLYHGLYTHYLGVGKHLYGHLGGSITQPHITQKGFTLSVHCVAHAGNAGKCARPKLGLGFRASASFRTRV